ncbi:hypothetical protein BN1723_013278 [Verticillium longisporum]|uniref:NACHT-NTPase and P-loop NTPases N-terminal domain-containing protein n=1 Tax=Verticillium longisporum TaxID=100787 RepID=A0A0G4LQY1_VERLO|nr:hypothetical protein BN1723_013278 [Verticillium longisporum]
MDPASAIGVASAVISFVDFGIKIIRGAIQIYGDANRDNDWQTPEDVAKKMTNLARNLRQPSGFGATPDEGEIAELAKTCMTLAERLAALFKSLQPKDARSKRQCLWAAAKAKLKQADVEDLEKNKAEHMVNAAFLVEHWNSEVSGRMDAWTRLADPEPAHDDTAAPKRPTDAQGKPYFGFWNPTGKAPGKGGASDNTLLVPYPRRAGLLTNTTSFVKEVIIESQLRASRLGDGLGRGKREDKALLRFDEVWTPCIWDGAASNPCKHSDKHLFYSPFTLGERAIREAARQTAEAVAMRLFAKEGEYDTAASGWRVEGAAKMRRAGEKSFRVKARSARVCPDMLPP